MNPQELLGRALRDEGAAWPADVSWDGEVVADLLDLHGVAGLVLRHPLIATWPAAVRRVLQEKAVGFAMWELRHQAILQAALSAIDATGALPVLIKGSALAYGIYDNPALRFRGDTDIVISPRDRAAVHGALIAQGFERIPAISGEFISYQASYEMPTPEGGRHVLDIHWKINNSEVLSRLFTHDELLAQAQPLPRLSAHARAASNVHALLLASMHRATHRINPIWVNGSARYCPDRLIWLYDIHLLSARLDETEWQALVALAASKGLRAITLDAMARADASFGAQSPPRALAALAEGLGRELPNVYLESTTARQFWLDMLALDTTSNRFQKLRELLIPSSDYMRQKYADRPQESLVRLYARRAVGGVMRRFG